MGGQANKKTALFLQMFGWLFILTIWYIITIFNMIPATILPSPISVFKAIGELYTDRNLPFHIIYSIFINMAGYVEAIASALVLGFIIGLFPFFRHLLSKQIDALRFLPLPSTTGIFMAMFGLTLLMKINFLGFGIFIYLLPTVVQRIDEVEKVHLQTIWTLNASKWHTLTKVYIPSVLSRVSNDIMVLVAISWTYIVIIEVIGNVGGLGGLQAVAERGRTDIVYALLILIVTIGFFQDKLFKRLDKLIFKFKYA
jgi:NitT/TauT family transport system permease protein